MSDKQRENDVKRQQRKLKLQNTLIVIAVVAVFGFFVYTSVSGMLDKKTDTHYVETHTLSDYMTSLDEEGVQ